MDNPEASNPTAIDNSQADNSQADNSQADNSQYLHAAETSEVVRPLEEADATPAHSVPAETGTVAAEAVSTEPTVADKTSTDAEAVAPAPKPQDAPQKQDAPPKPPLERIAAGAFSLDLFSNAPAAAVKRFILTRAGFGPDSPEISRLPDVRFDSTDKTLPCLPEVFPPDNWPQDKPLQSVADWLACVDACQQAEPAEDAK